MKRLTLAAALLMLTLGSTSSHAATYVVKFGGNLANGGTIFSGGFNIDDTVPTSSADNWHQNAIDSFTVQSDGFRSLFGGTTITLPTGNILVTGDWSNKLLPNTLTYVFTENRYDPLYLSFGWIYLNFPIGSFANSNIPTKLPDFGRSGMRQFSVRIGDKQVFGAITSISIAPAGVPEPANWALLIGGLGLTGGALRRRRAVAGCALAA